jgi:nucleoside-diphosphate-sugar epimerase
VGIETSNHRDSQPPNGNGRILITGGAGFIGHHLVGRLAHDHPGAVTVVDNLHRGDVANLGPCARDIVFRRQDIRDRPALDEAMRGCEVVFHLAAQSSVMGALQDTEYSCSTNVLGTFHVLEAASRAGVKRVVFTSSREVYGEPDHIPVPETALLRPKNPYGASKAAGEMYCRVFGQNSLQVVVLRLANVYGPRDTERVIPLFVERALRGLPLLLYDGTQILDFVWIDTVVDALVKAGFGEFSSEPLNIGAGKGITIAGLARRILDLTNSRSTLKVEERRNVEVSRFVADTTRAQARLGLPTPEDPLFRLEEVVKWFRAASVNECSPT